MAHVRHGQGVGLARRHGCHGIPRPRGAQGGLRARALWRAVLAHRGRQDLPASLRRAHHRIRRRSGRPAHLRRRRPDRPCHPAHALRPEPQAQCRVLHRVFRHRPHHDRRRLHRRGLLEARRRHHACLQRQDGGAGHRRLWARLFLGDLGPYLHRRRQRHGGARRPAASGHGVRPVPPDRHLWRRLPHHRRRTGRGRLSHQFRGRAVHGALRAQLQGPGAARLRQRAA